MCVSVTRISLEDEAIQSFGLCKAATPMMLQSLSQRFGDCEHVDPGK